MKEVRITRDIQESANICSSYVRNQLEGLAIFRPTEVCALITTLDTTNKEFVEANNIKTIRLGNAGGCIVAFPDNLEMGYFTRDIDSTFLERLPHKVADYLKAKGLNASVDNNDILIDETYKVFSTSKATYDKAILFGAIHVSINCDAELIDQICTKPMKKIPKGLSEYGITSDEMLDLIVRLYEQE